MTISQRLKVVVAKFCDAAMLMVAGAWLLAAYLVYTNPQLEHVLKDIRAGLPLAFWMFYLLSSFLGPNVSKPGPKDLSPRWSGVSVVVATGIAGAIFVANSSASNSYVAVSAIAVGTLVIAVSVWRFATVHAAEIGEARFVSNSSR